MSKDITTTPDQALQFAPAMVPATMHLEASVVRDLQFILGGVDDDEPFVDGVMWVGTMPTDDGKVCYGLHVYSSEYPEEGSITLATFDPVSDQSPRAHTLEEGDLRELLERLDAGLEYEGDLETENDHIELFNVEAAQELFSDAAAAIRALSSQPVADHIADAGKMVADGSVSTKSHHVNGGAFRRLTQSEWRELGGNSNPLCDWHEGIGYVIYDDQAHQEYLKKTNALPASPGASECEICNGTGRVGPYFPGGLSTGCGNCSPTPQKDGAK